MYGSETAMRKVLVIACYFPPQGGAGVQRTLKFVKYLPQFGWQPVILTARPTGRLQDASLLAEVPKDVAVYHTPILRLPSHLPWRLRQLITRWLLLVDEQLGWLPFVVPAGRRIIKEQNIAALYTTSAPYTDHLIGLRLKRQTGLPWFADFRDPWADNFAATYATAWHHHRIHNLERQVFSSAERIGVTSQRQREFYGDKYGDAVKAKVIALTNGYDADDFQMPLPRCSNNRAPYLTLAYAGSLYGKQQTAQYFLQGLRRALDTGAIPASRIQTYLVGNISHQTMQLIEQLELSHVVVPTGYKSHQESIRYLLAADALLLILGPGPHSELVIPGKVFEYLAAQRPILALIPPGATADLLTDFGNHLIVAPENIAGIAESLKQLYEAWEAQTLRVPFQPEKLQAYERRTLTAVLARALDEMVKA